MKTCFVISPIGVPGSDVREHADDVFDFIIKPAVEKAGYNVKRADHEARPGAITEQMYEVEWNAIPDLLSRPPCSNNARRNARSP
jgi:hypothetical protein